MSVAIASHCVWADARTLQLPQAPPATLHTLLFLIILFWFLGFSLSVVWVCFVWSPFWSPLLSSFWEFVSGCAFPVFGEGEAVEFCTAVPAWVTTTQFP